MPDPRPRRAKRSAAVAALLALLAAAPYLNTLHNDFVYDDLAQVVRNGLVRTLDLRPIVAGGAVTHGIVEWYRPATIYSLSLNFAAGRLDPAGYHAINIALHAVCTLLVGAIAWRLLGSQWGAILAAALFAVHAVHTDAVTPISGRADLLASFFVLFTWWIAIESDNLTARSSAVIFVSTLLALLSKESAIALLPVVALTEFVKRRARAGRWRLYGAIAMATVAWVAIRWMALGGFAPGAGRIRYIENPLIEASFGERLVTSAWIIIRYAALFVLPWPLSADYSFRQIPTIQSWDDRRIVVLAIAIATVAMAMRLLRRRSGDRANTGPASWRSVALLVAMFLLLIAPVSNIVLPIGTIMAERLLYLPSAALCLAAGAAATVVGTTSRRRASVTIVVAIVVAAHVAVALTRNRDWRSDAALFTATVRTAPNSAKAHFNLASTMYELRDPGAAEISVRKALDIAPVYPEAHNLLGTLLLARGEVASAEAEFRLAVRDAPDYAPALANLGIALRRLDRHAEAERHLLAAVDRDPSLAMAWLNLGLLAETRGDRDAAIARYRRAYELAPDLEVARARVIALSAHGPAR